MSQWGWRLYQATVIVGAFYADYETSTASGVAPRPAMALIGGIIVAASSTVCFTALFDNCRKLLAAITRRRAAHVAEAQRQNGSLPTVGREVSQLLQDLPRRRVGQDSRDLL